MQVISKGGGSMTREKLEGLDWSIGEDEGENGSGGPFLYTPEIDDEEGMKLAAAAPELALACLQARDLLSTFPPMVKRGGAPIAERVAESYANLLTRATAALAAAGVEVSDGK
jgi:hypothetical protein